MNPARFRHPAFLVALAVLAVGAIGMGSAIRMAKIYLDKLPVYPRPIDGKPHAYPEGYPTLLALPSETRNWKQFGQDRVETEEVEDVLGTTNYVTRTYVEKNSPSDRPARRLEFHSTYYTDQIDTVPHIPDRCFVGGGMQIGSAPVVIPLNLDPSSWQPDPDAPPELRGRVFKTRMSSDFGNGHGRRIRLPLDPGQIKMKAMQFLTKEGGSPFYAGYFFIANGGTVASADDVRGLAFDLTADYAYYLKVQFTSDQVKSAEELRDAASDLMNDMLPELMLCLPDWVEVQTGAWPPDNPRAKAPAPRAAPQGGSGERR